VEVRAELRLEGDVDDVALAGDLRGGERGRERGQRCGAERDGAADQSHAVHYSRLGEPDKPEFVNVFRLSAAVTRIDLDGDLAHANRSPRRAVTPAH